MNLGGLAQALGLGVAGYGQDQQLGLDRERKRLLDDRAGVFQAAQMRDFDANAALRGEQQKTAADKLLSNQRAYGTFSKNFTDHPLAQAEFDPGTDYQSLLKDALQQRVAAQAATVERTRTDAANKVTAERDDKRYKEQTDLEKMRIGATAPKYVWAKGPDGKVIRVTEADAAAQHMGMPDKAPGAGNQNAPSMAAAKANLESARKIMDEFEAKYKAGQVGYSPFQATKGALASSPEALTAKGPLGAIHSYLANKSYSSLQKEDPEVARYMTAKKYVAEAVLNTHKRPNQTQYEIEQELSGMGPDAAPNVVDMGKTRRDKMWEEVFSNPNAGAVQSAGAPINPPSYEAWKATQKKDPPQSTQHPSSSRLPSEEQQLWDQAVKEEGVEKVLKEFGPRP